MLQETDWLHDAAATTVYAATLRKFQIFVVCIHPGAHCSRHVGALQQACSLLTLPNVAGQLEPLPAPACLRVAPPHQRPASSQTCPCLGAGWVATDMGNAAAAGVSHALGKEVKPPLEPPESVGSMLQFIDRLEEEHAGGFFFHDGRPHIY